MRRREFIAGVAGAAAWPLAARAQQVHRVRRVAVLGLSQYFSIFQRHLEGLGWRAERDIQFEVRASGNMEQMSRSAAELVAWSPDVILAPSNLAVDAIKPVAESIPIVFVAGDPVGSGFVASLARPGGTVTGFETYVPTMGGKWLEVLKETAPHVTRAMAIMVPETAVHQAFWKSIQESAPRLGIAVVAAGVHNAAEIEAAITSFAEGANGGLISLPHAVTSTRNQS